MKKGVVWRVILIAVTLVLSIVFFLPNLPLFQNMPDWWKKNMPSKGIVLGLDLQGGVHLVFEVEGDKAVAIATERIASSLGGILERKKLQATVKKEGSFITVTPASSEIGQVIKDNYPILTLAETAPALKYKLAAAEEQRIRDMSADQVLEVIRNRIDTHGVKEPTIQRQADNEIIVQLPGEKDPKGAINLIGQVAQLEFKLVDDQSPLAAELPSFVSPGEEGLLLERFKDKVPEGSEILFLRDKNRETGVITKRPILVKKQTLLSGDMVTQARSGIGQDFNVPDVNMTFSSAGAKVFDEVTAQNVGRRLAIILDNTVYSAPNINERISGGSAQITGNFTMEEATELANVISNGSLPVPMRLLQNVTVGPSLGRDSIDAGKLAGMVATVLVIVFMVVYYKFSGLIADFAMVLNIFLLLGAMAAINATLTLPGIAGIILTIGMAVDSNVLMFERMREELREGKTPKAAVQSGYKKAFWTIFDSHVTTLLTAFVLYQFGTGPIKGFAVTLMIGIAINLFTALIGTRTVFDILHSRGEVKRLSI